MSVRPHVHKIIKVTDTGRLKFLLILFIYFAKYIFNSGRYEQTNNED